MGDDEAELGLGIHGEPGVEKIDLAAISAIVATMAGRLAATLPPGERRPRADPQQPRRRCRRSRWA